MTPLQAVIVKILRARGFEVMEKDGYILTKIGGEEAAFHVVRKAGKEDVDAFLARFSRFRGRKVLATAEPLPTFLLEQLDDSVVVWGRQAIERELDIMDGRVDGSGPVDDLLVTDTPRFLPYDGLDALYERSLGERIVRPVMTANEAMRLARDSIAGHRQCLQLLPHYVFGYICPLFHGDEEVGVEQGVLSVNGLTQRVEPWPGWRDTVYSLEEEHKKIETSMTEEDAANIARRELVRINTVDRDKVVKEEHVTLTEKWRIAPRGGNIELEPLGIYYVPLRRVEGIHGTVTMDASTGRVVSEDHCPF